MEVNSKTQMPPGCTFSTLQMLERVYDNKTETRTAFPGGGVAIRSNKTSACLGYGSGLDYEAPY